MAIGAALTGMRPVLDMMFSDFSLLAMDQIINQAAHLRYMTGGQTEMPLRDPHADRRRRSVRGAALADALRDVRLHPGAHGWSCRRTRPTQRDC